MDACHFIQDKMIPHLTDRTDSVGHNAANGPEKGEPSRKEALGNWNHGLRGRRCQSANQRETAEREKAKHDIISIMPEILTSWEGAFRRRRRACEGALGVSSLRQAVRVD